MLHCFKLIAGKLSSTNIEVEVDPLENDRLWIDAVYPSEEEVDYLSRTYQISIDPPEDLDDIESTARLYEDDVGDIVIRSDFLTHKTSGFYTTPVLFFLRKNLLISIHNEDIPSLRLLRMRSRVRSGNFKHPMDILIHLLRADVEYSADSLEDVYGKLREISSKVLTQNGDNHTDTTDILSDITRQEDLNSIIRRNLMDTRRAMVFLQRDDKNITRPQAVEIKQALRDIDSLDGHTAFIFEKVNFLLGSTLGFINLSQNKVIKIFSVVSVAMLPPTLIASIYGMNFAIMPELQWKWGYPYALGLMLVSIVLPFIFFRKKGWLK